MIIKNRYQVIEPLASGGFGQTFLAEDTDLFRRLCVVKQLKPINGNPQIYQQIQKLFEREAKVLQDLGRSTDRIPELYAYFTESDLFYLVQEWVEGQTLAHRIKTKGLFTENAVKRFLEEVLPILQEIHRRGIVHRDIKPSNLILRKQDDIPVLIDFGAVKEIVSTVATREGYVEPSTRIGTPGFMSPEQEVCRPVSPSSDLYSLGVTAIYLLTGKSPEHWPVDQSGQTLWRHFAPTVSDEFATVLDKAIQFDPADRYPIAQDMLDALQSTVEATLPPTKIRPIPDTSSIPPTQVSLTPPSTAAGRTKSWLPSVIGAGVAICLSAITGYLYFTYRAAQEDLQGIRDAKAREDYPTCVSQSESFAQVHAKPYFSSALNPVAYSSLNPVAEAERLGAECSLAIALQTYLQKEVPQQLRDKNQAGSATTIDEIKPTVQVSDQQVVIAYQSSARPDLVTEENVKRLAVFFMSALRGSPDQTLPSKHTDFAQLLVYPEGQPITAILTADQWNAYLEKRESASAEQVQKLTEDLMNQIKISTSALSTP